MLTETLAELGLRGATENGPAWRRDNPFLLKTSRAETRGFGLSLRLGMAALILAGLLLGGLWLWGAYPAALGRSLVFLPGGSFPAILFAVLSFVHVLLVSNTRTGLAVSLGDEARRGTLPALLLTPLPRAEMLLAMGIGPARGAFLVALAGLPVYGLLAEFGGLSWHEIASLYVLLALLSYSPPAYALPALSGAAPTPDNPLTAQTFQLRGRANAPRTGVFSAAWLWIFLSVLFFSQAFSLIGSAWLSHFLLALQVSLPGGPMGHIFGQFLLFFSWPYYVVQIFGEKLNFFHVSCSPLWIVLPLAGLHWIASALSSAAALSAGSIEEMRRLPLFSRAQTLSRWTARLAGFCFLGLVWKAWVESGDAASLANGGGGGAGWDAAGLALLLGGLSLYGVISRALAVPIRKKDGLSLRPFALTLRRAIKRSLRPLTMAGVTFLLACALGSLSPFAPTVGKVAGRVLLVGLSAIIWVIGLRRLLPGPATERFIPRALLYGLPFAALFSPVPILWNLAALSPASAWLSLFPDGPAMLTRFPRDLWTLGTLPSFEVCLVGPVLTGLALAGLSSVISRPAPARPALSVRPAKLVKERNSALTASLLAWVTTHTDNPLFTQELRARTRSGRWADWRYLAPGVFLAAAVLGVTYPAFVDNFSVISPFHFFERLTVWTNLASLLLIWQCYVLGFRGQAVGETLIVRDRQRGLWGFILITPLTVRQIFWGKVFGQTSGAAASWAVCAFVSLILYALAAPTVGLIPAASAWLIGQIFVAALYVLGVGLGAALATFPIFLKALRGLSTLLFVCVVGGGVYVSLNDLPDVSMPTRLLLGSLYAALIAVPTFLFAQWRIALLRRRDIAFGDGVE